VKDLPATEKSLVIRTDFSADAGWNAVCEAMARPWGGEEFQDDVECLSDREYEGMTVRQLAELAADDEDLTFAFLVDHLTLTLPGYPVLAVDLWEEEPGRSFRTVPAEVWTIHTNLSLATMAFADFADAADADGIYRGL
jgi:hypothetical protein